MDQISAEFIKELFNKNKTYENISYILRQRFSGSKEFSVISRKRFFKKNCVSPTYQKNITERLYQKLWMS